jgi:transposase-like protein
MRKTRREYWSKLIAEQEASGRTVEEFCRERGRGKCSFYRWRKRLREDGAVRFARVETRPTEGSRGEATLELVLISGERLRIGPGVDAATLQMVLEVVRP